MAMIGISFSIGFIVGPLIGAYFARKMTDYGVVPAYIAFTLAAANVVYLTVFFKETLPAENRVSVIDHDFNTLIQIRYVTRLFACLQTLFISSGLGKAADYINPSSLFQFKPISKISDAGECRVLRVSDPLGKHGKNEPHAARVPDSQCSI